MKTQVLKDKYGVQIEVGYFVAHPSGSYGGGSYVSILQVKEITPGRVNGRKLLKIPTMKKLLLIF